MNGLPSNVPSARSVLFADDANFLFSAESADELQLIGDAVLKEVSTWCSANKLSVNINKTSFIEFSIHRVANPNQFQFEIGGRQLLPSEFTNFLGVSMDRSLSWSYHAETLLKKLNSAAFAISKISRVLSWEAVVSAYHGYFESLLAYGILLWGGSTFFLPVFRAQKRVLRLMFGRPAGFPCTSLFKSAGILTVPSLYIYHLAIFAFRSRESWVTGSDIHTHNTRFRTMIRVEQHRTHFYEMNPNYVSKKVFNSLPDAIKNAPSVSVLKLRLKPWLIENCFYSLQSLLN